MRDLVKEALSLHEAPQMLDKELYVIYQKLEEYWKGGNTIEFGAYKGMTSYVIAGYISEHSTKDSPGRHYAVDVWTEGKGDWNWPYGKHTKSMYLKNVKPFIDWIVPIKGMTLDNDVMTEILQRTYDFAYLDADHREATTMMDLFLIDQVAEHILIHDYGHPHVTAGTDRFLRKMGYTVEVLVPGTGLYEIKKC